MKRNSVYHKSIKSETSTSDGFSNFSCNFTCWAKKNVIKKFVNDETHTSSGFF